MAKKKETAQPVEKVEEVAEQVIEQGKEQPAIYRRETLMQMDEIKAYGLNRYFLTAILCNEFYTLKEAHSLIQSVI